MRRLGIDYGEKRIGLAISDPLGITARGLTVVEKKADFVADAKAILEAVQEYLPLAEIIVGLPKRTGGQIGREAQRVLDFIMVLQQELHLPVKSWDERFTTQEAQRNLSACGLSAKKSRQVIDKSAAALILQGYLDGQRHVG